MPKSALIIIDMYSRYDFPGADSLAEQGPGTVERIGECRRLAASCDVPVVFANDIHDHFSGSRESIYARALDGEHPELVRPLEPAENDSFVHKGQHSAFYGTPMAHLLHEWGIDRLILTGQVTEQCVLYTALDAHVRHYDVTVLTDCVSSIDPELGDAALRMMAGNMGADLSTSNEWNP